jgi:hypothetical protein
MAPGSGVINAAPGVTSPGRPGCAVWIRSSRARAGSSAQVGFITSPRPRRRRAAGQLELRVRRCTGVERPRKLRKYAQTVNGRSPVRATAHSMSPYKPASDNHRTGASLSGPSR